MPESFETFDPRLINIGDRVCLEHDSTQVGTVRARTIREMYPPMYQVLWDGDTSPLAYIQYELRVVAAAPVRVEEEEVAYEYGA